MALGQAHRAGFHGLVAELEPGGLLPPPQICCVFARLHFLPELAGSRTGGGWTDGVRVGVGVRVFLALQFSRREQVAGKFGKPPGARVPCGASAVGPENPRANEGASLLPRETSVLKSRPCNDPSASAVPAKCFLCARKGVDLEPFLISDLSQPGLKQILPDSSWGRAGGAPEAEPGYAGAVGSRFGPW